MRQPVRGALPPKAAQPMPPQYLGSEETRFFFA